MYKKIILPIIIIEITSVQSLFSFAIDRVKIWREDRLFWNVS